MRLNALKRTKRAKNRRFPLPVGNGDCEQNTPIFCRFYAILRTFKRVFENVCLRGLYWCISIFDIELSYASDILFCTRQRRSQRRIRGINFDAWREIGVDCLSQAEKNLF
jgi:hypothetical protein